MHQLRLMIMQNKEEGKFGRKIGKKKNKLINKP